jgi:hypothetical protein
MSAHQSGLFPSLSSSPEMVMYIGLDCGVAMKELNSRYEHYCCHFHH